MNNQKKYNMFIFISMFGRTLIESFPPIILYKSGAEIKEIILYFLFRYLLAIPINYIFTIIIKKTTPKLMITISSITIGIAYYYLYNMNNTIPNIFMFSFLTSIYVYSYWIVRNYYLMHTLDNENINNCISNVLIITTLVTIFPSYIGAFIIDKYGLIPLTIIVFILNTISVLPLLNIDIKRDLTREQNKIKLKKEIITIMILDQFKVLLLSIIPIYVFINISQTYSYIGINNICIGIASTLILYIMSKKRLSRKRCINKYLLILVITIGIKLLNNNPYIFLVLSLIDYTYIKLEEIEINKIVYKLGLNYNYLNYLLITETIFNISRLIISSILFLMPNLLIMISITLIGLIIESIYIIKFDKNQWKC